MAETVAVVSSVFGCLTVVVTLVSPCLRDPLSDEYNIFRKRKENLATLQSEIQNLKQQISEVERQSKEKVVSKSLKVSEWLKKADKFMNDVADSNFEGRLLENCCGLPYCRSQYNAGKEIAERITQLTALEKEGEKYINVAESNVVGQLIGTTKSVGGAARTVEEIKKYVTEKVTENGVGTIRVYGVAGCGKTKVVAEVNDLVLNDCKNCASEDVNNRKENELFDKVISVTVENNLGSTEASIENLQKKIAEKLQVDLNNSPGSRADTLGRALKKLKFLIILDDMWTEFSLEAIGIPRPNKVNGCKLIIVSRSLPVCSDIHIDKKFEIKLLSGTDAEALFETEAGIKLSQLGDDTRATAKNMIDERDGFPLAIILLARALRESKTDDAEDVDGEWKKALTWLKESTAPLESMNERAFARLKYSYDMLKKDAQQCFLYCALYPAGHDIEKKELVEYWFWEGLLDGRKRSGQIEDMKRAKEIIDELNGAHLLEIESQEGGKEYIKMRNLVRHMAVHLTKMSPDQFLIKAGEKLSDFPSQGEYWSEVERASLMRNEFKALREEPKFPKLSTLLLQHNPITHLHDNFFRSMPNIKVLDLSHTHIFSLPKSTFSNLTKLKALLLRNCQNLHTLPSLSTSKKLLVLDLSDTPITRLPDGMKQLTSLIRLNLSGTNVGELEAELVHALQRLKELLMITNDAGSLWGSTKGASVKELGALSHLAILHINFVDAEAFNRYVNSRNHSLSKFKFCVGGSCKKPLPDNSIAFINSNILVKGKPVSLPQDTSELHVMRNLDLRCLPSCCLDSLKVINISGCESLVYLFNINMVYNLPNLETISVEKCQKMEALIEWSEYPDDSLHSKNLKFIHISDCGKLVYLFRIEMLRFMPNLQEISIRQRQLSTEVGKEPYDPPAIHPRLQDRLFVDPLKLKSIYSNVQMEGNSQQTIWNFPELKMHIITSLPAKPRNTPLSGANQLQRNRSFESVLEAQTKKRESILEEAPIACGILSRTVGRNDKIVYSPQLSPRGRDVQSIIQRGNEFRFDYPAPRFNLGTEDPGNPLRNLFSSVTYYGAALLHKLLSPSAPPGRKMLQDQDEHVI
ncbi:putative disease resistance protein [Rosa sericea]